MQGLGRLLIVIFILIPTFSIAGDKSGSEHSLQTQDKVIEKASDDVPLERGSAIHNEKVTLPQHDLSPYGMYLSADWVVKAVMLLLLAASIVTWSIAIAKQLQLRVSCRRAKYILTELLDSETLAEGKLRCHEAQGAGLHLLSATLKELELSARADKDNGIKERLQLRLERVQVGLSRTILAGTGVLATVGSVGPFVGLLGTVWGIMNAFIGIAKSQNTTLAVVAPGIAEALLATAIGLIAAIPAVVLYNHFTRGVGHYRALMADISAALMVLVSRDLDRTPIIDEKMQPSRGNIDGL